MNKLLSINNKFFKLMPKNFFKLIEKYNIENDIQGFEFYVSTLSEKEYLKKLINIADKKYIFNLHAPTFQEIQQDYEYIDFAVGISKTLGKKINIVYHPLVEKTKEKSIRNTLNKIENIFLIIDQKHYDSYIDISIENLNGLNRLKKEDFVELFSKFKKLRFTYDIGHEIVDGINNENLDNIFEERLNNIHIHTFDKKTKNDHYPIIDINKEKNIKKLLERYGKNQNIVLEYALDYISGNSFEEKIKNYIKSSKII